MKEYLNKLFNTCLLPPEKVKIALELFDERVGLTSAFWNQVKQEPSLGTEVVNELQFTMKLGEFTMNHLPLIQELQRRRKTKAIKHVKNLLEQDWVSLITKRVKGKIIGTPPDFLPEEPDKEQKVKKYVEVLQERIPECFPLAAISHQLDIKVEEPKKVSAGKPQIKIAKEEKIAASQSFLQKINRIKNLKEFLQKNPYIDLQSNPMEKTRSADINDSPGSIKRLLKVAPPKANMDLYVNGLNSAHKIARMGKANFLAQYSPKLKQEAKRIHTKSSQQSLMALNLFTKYSPVFNSVNFAALSSSSQDVSEIPNWNSLFGTLNICDIVDDRSVLSPAAYLIDILHFLSEQKLTSSIYPLFLMDDIEEISLLIQKLHNKSDAVSQYLASQFSSDTNRMIEYIENSNIDPVILKRTLVAELNKIIKNGSLYDGQRFAGVTLSEETLKLIARNPENDELEYLNRHLLEDTYSWEIAKLKSVSALDIFLERRPDIAWLELSGVNTYTTLPYIDIVNEVLEAAVFPLEFAIRPTTQESLDTIIEELGNKKVSTLLKTEFEKNKWIISENATISTTDEYSDCQWYIHDGERIFELNLGYGGLDVSVYGTNQTDATSDQLATNPEYNPRAYDCLAQEIYPWNLPFDIWAEISRVYLKHLGIPRYKLWEIFNAGKTELINLAIEYFGISESEREIIVGQDQGNSPWLYWGFSEIDLLPESSNVKKEKLWVEKLKQVSIFLEKSGLDYESLIDLLNTSFINPTGSIELNFLSSSDDGANTSLNCDIDRAIISNISAAKLNDIHRFICLQRKTGWTIPQLDQVIRVMDWKKLDDKLIIALRYLRQLQVDLHEDLDELLCWYAPIDTKPGPKRAPSFYEQLFLDKSVVSPVDEYFLLNDKRNDLAINVVPEKNKETIKGHAPTIIAGLKITEAELDLVLADEFPTTSEGQIPDAPLNLQNLSRIFRIVSFSRALNLSIKNFLSFRTMCNINPFSKKNIAGTFHFIEKFNMIKRSNFNFSELEYLVFNNADVAEIAPEDEQITLVLSEIYNGLMRINTELLFNTKVEDSSQLDNQELPENLKEEFQNNGIELSLNISVIVESKGKEWLITDEQDRETYTVKKEDNRLSIFTDIERRKENYIKHQLAHALNLETQVMDLLLIQWVEVTNEKAMNIFLALTLKEAETELTVVNFPEQFKCYRIINKIAVMINKFDIKPFQLEWFFNDDPRKSSYFKLTKPVEFFNHFERMMHLFRLRDELGEDVLSAIFNNQDIDENSVINENDFNCLKEHGFLPENYWDMDRLQRFLDCYSALKRIGVAAEDTFEWAKPNLTSDEVRMIARNIKHTVKAKYNDQQWFEIAKPLEHALREKRRNALVSYHKGKMGIYNTHDLYQHFLLDVDMSSCMQTSRTKLAISSVQLFVQRCLMNLESWQIPSSEQAGEWKHLWQWMKNYRVWEANRKIFLYPENWIEPELRRNKSPFFKELESELLMGEMTSELAERAFRNYIEKLNDVSRLEICGFYHEKEFADSKEDGDVTSEVLHNFGRTRETPKVYYYRRRVDDVWTAWEQMNVDIEGDHLIPVVFNKRLYLFWPLFTEKSETLKDRNGHEIVKNDGNQKTWEFWELQLAYSEYRQEMWSVKKISDQKIIIDPMPVNRQAEFNKLESENKKRHLRAPNIKQDITFKTLIDKQELYILCAKFNGKPNVMKYEFTNGFRFMKDSQVDIIQELNEFNNYAFTCSVKSGYYENMLVKLDEKKLSFMDDTNHEVEILNQIHFPCSIILSHQLPQKDWQDYFFYQDEELIFFVERIRIGDSEKYYFELGDHPLTHEFMNRLNRDGIDGLLKRSVQEIQHSTCFRRIDAYESIWLKSKDLDNIRRIFREHGFKANVTGIDRITQIDNTTWEITDIRLEGNNKIIPSCYVKLEADGLYFYQNLFSHQYVPTDKVMKPYPKLCTDFDADGFYSLYNWELFFHAPLLIADHLSHSQRFEEAQQWFHYIFDPTDTSMHPAPQRYWNTLPFFEEALGKPIQELLALLQYRGTKEELQKMKRKLEKQINQWRQDPFEPHLIAQLRTGAYQKTVVMKYIDNLIAWGDQLFRQDSIESINEAAQLYILAAEILGKKPTIIPPPWDEPPMTFEQMFEFIDEFSNGPVLIEESIPEASTPKLTQTAGIEAAMGSSLYVACAIDDSDSKERQIPYFGIPRNDTLMSYWDTVADRLFKIRYCQNIEGVERQLPLFQPPIEPGMLVRAVAAGVDISSALHDLEISMPNYRFRVLLNKAIDLCNSVKSLGVAFLSALEKRDVEELAKLRMGQKDMDLRSIKEHRIKEAKEILASLEIAKEIEQKRKNHLGDMPKWTVMGGIGLGFSKVGKAVEIGTSGYQARKAFQESGKKEKERVNKRSESFKSFGSGAELTFQEAAAAAYNLAGVSGSAIPTIIVGGAGAMASPVNLIVTGGEQVGSKLQAFGKVFETLGKTAELVMEIMNAVAQKEAQKAEWEYQSGQAGLEINKLEKQIEVAKIRIAIAQKELENYELEMKNKQEVDDYMRKRFTNLELYNWMVSQLSSLYFQSYQMAYDLAKRAEKAYHYEVGQEEISYIKFGYWDSLKKGLLAGDKLYYDLKRMETAYLEQNKRNYEITKNISLAAFFPDKFTTLKKDGTCDVDLPEVLFDLDYPGHFLRRIKSVSLTVDCQVASSTNINCTLTLTRSTVRMNTRLDGSYGRMTDGDDPRFKDMVGVVQSIATSSAQHDNGLFELNFEDERYLPFEGAGAISSWKIELLQDCNQIEIKAISDVVLHISYTAREGGSRLKEMAKEALEKKLKEQTFGRIIDVMQECPDTWNGFIEQPANNDSELILPVTKSFLPAMFHKYDFEIKDTKLLVVLKDNCCNNGFSLPFTLVDQSEEHKFELDDSRGIAVCELVRKDFTELYDNIQIKVKKDNASRLKYLENMLVIMLYSIK